MIEFIFLKELILKTQTHENSVKFVIIGILKISVLSINLIFAMFVMFYNSAIVYVKGSVLTEFIIVV